MYPTRRAITLGLFVALHSFALLFPVQAQTSSASIDDNDSVPSQSYTLGLSKLAPGVDFKLYGIQNKQHLEFSLRRDQLVTDAVLNLVFTPSPALLPKLSHLRVYLNEELMGVVPVDDSQSGQPQKRSLTLDPTLLTSFNRVRLEFVGHYTDTCENLAHSSLWLDISGKTNIAINQQALPLANDLSYFPEPFIDTLDMRAQRIPFVFSVSPTLPELRAASVLASYFGTKGQWRQLSFPAFYDELPSEHAVVFAINEARPEFLRGYPEVNGPTIDMISAPDNPYQKLLLILGRDDKDISAAVSALALGSPLFRGQSVRVEETAAFAPRKPYDAPNWIPTNRPVFLSELVSYPGQLEVTGLRPPPITLPLNLPPDLFVWRNNGIPLQLGYRYTAPKVSDESRLTLSLNGRFLDSYLLEASDHKSALARMRLQVLGNDAVASSESLMIPALRIGARNEIRFNFSFSSTVGASERDGCRTIMPVDSHASIDDRSVIDFSGYMHYLEMPNLKAFANSGFPFSRMADLSETIVVMPARPTPLQASTLFEELAHIGAQVGYPAVKVRVTNDWAEALQLDADLLWIGEAPDTFRSRPDANLLLENATASLRQPGTERGAFEARHSADFSSAPERDAASEIRVRALGPIAAIVGMQSERFPQRSMVGLMASTNEDYGLLRGALADTGKRDSMYGSVAIIRESGVASELVGPRYFVGQLHWWQHIWLKLSDKPVLLAITAVFTVLLVAILLWNGLRWVARRRLSRDA
ncbi:cellulose biosynthesis cyclic di-GMP-binding regulatory protein BcsB [Pollutimonas subterranea]|uniref:Cyclic di-GMP-binding protein n=1 Tax=Pollutimonas subterranea TaxID=2045210 RepID=A0A2N4U038_9BURK|nr:cellulose biosynthesis cyclic di-GMP-binding regulatory protein BcsB [Pollutimonas subterranea]PLC48378.1 cellulose biosynthesis cyclic di-GMP-binding regulatory protein BcsB [Pollutimonas subterranea]